MQNTQDFDQIIDQTAARLRDLISKRDQLADQQKQIAAVTADIQRRQEQLDLPMAPVGQTNQTSTAVVQRQGVKRYAGTGKPVKVRQPGTRRHGGGRPFSETSKKMLEVLAAAEALTAAEMAEKAGVRTGRACSRLQAYLHAGYVQVVNRKPKTIHSTYTRNYNVYELTEMGKIKVNQFREVETGPQVPMPVPGTQTPTQQQRTAYTELTPTLRKLYNMVAFQNHSYADLKEHSGVREAALDHYLRRLVLAGLIRVVSKRDGVKVTDKTITVL